MMGREASCLGAGRSDAHCDRMFRSRQVRAHAGGKIDDLLEGEGIDNTKSKHESQISWEASWGINQEALCFLVWASLVIFSSRSALIRNSSPVPRSSSSSNYTLFFSPSFLCILEFLLLFSLGSATGHRPARTHYYTYSTYNWQSLHWAGLKERKKAK